MRFKVGKATDPIKLASAIVSNIEQGIELATLGAAAVNQAVKALAITVSMAARDDITISSLPYFESAEIDGEERTFIIFKIKKD